jgi:Zn-dependent protease with chaperone function
MLTLPKPTLLYKTGLLLVTITMLILPIIYVALTAAVWYATYIFATKYFLAILTYPISGQVGIILRLLGSVTPLVAGIVVGFFMIKPLFARRAKPVQSLALNPEIDERMYALVQAVSDLVGSPKPSRIELNCSLNASAGFDKGGFLGNRLVLALGLPLVAGLTQRELAGVIAHEFGHFRQGAGMRLSTIVRRVNGWFSRVIYERDAWDEMVESWGRDSEGWVGLAIACVRGGIWLSRGVLWLLMMAGHMVCCFLMRHMEYDADRAEIELAGSAAFESTTLKLATLGKALGDIQQEMRRSWRNNHRLPDNLPVLLQYRERHIPAEKRHAIESSVGLSKTGLFDTHPSPSDRVREARRLGRPGCEISDEPASELFENFEAVSKMVTLAYYEDDLEVPTTGDFLIPVELMTASKPRASGAKIS